MKVDLPTERHEGIFRIASDVPNFGGYRIAACGLAALNVIAMEGVLLLSPSTRGRSMKPTSTHSAFCSGRFPFVLS